MSLHQSKKAKKKWKKSNTHWIDKEWHIGFINKYPDYETQGETLEELKENLLDLWKDLEEDKLLS